MRPFDIRSAKDEPSADRTLVGDDPVQAIGRRMALVTPQDKRMGLGAPSHLWPISPLSEAFRGRIATIADLVKTPGLNGIRLIDVTPDGYIAPKDRNRGSFRPLLQALGDFGYCEPLRLAFLRKSNVDPIDLAPSEPATNSDLRQPYFLDNALRGSWAIYDGADEPIPAMKEKLNEFRAWLSKLNREALLGMLDAIVRSNPQISIAIEPVTITTNGNHGANAPVAWSPGTPLPEEAAAQGRMTKAGQKMGDWRMSITSETEPWIRQTLGIIAAHAPSFRGFQSIILEFPSMEVKQADQWLTDTFLRP